MKYLIKPLFSLALLLVASVAFSQPALYVEGTHYETLKTPARTVDPKKIEVTEVFWYGCPHCYEFEPTLAGWIQKLPADVAFVRVHAVWNAGTKFHAQILATEQSLGSFAKTHQVVFDAIHKQRLNLVDQASVRGVFVSQGISADAFDKAWTSPEVAAAVKQYEGLMRNYEIDGVPTLIVNGKYKISSGENHAAMLKVAEFLIAKERARAKH